MFQENMEIMEKKENSVIEVYQILQKICSSLQVSVDNKFVPLKVRCLLKKIGENGKQHDTGKFKNEMESMYTQLLAYIKMLAKKLEKFKILLFMEFKDVPEWDDMQKFLDFLMKKE
jgi:hypothetical protein